MTEAFSVLEKAWFLWTVLGGIIGCLWKVYKLWSDTDKRISLLEQNLIDLKKAIEYNGNMSVRVHEQVKELRIEITAEKAESRSIIERVGKVEASYRELFEFIRISFADMGKRIDGLHDK